MNFSASICNLTTIHQSLAYHIWETQIYDRIIPPSQTRIFHNKPFFLAWDSVSCYASYFSPERLNSFIGVLGVILFFFGLYLLAYRRRWKLLSLIFLLPAPAIILTSPQVGQIAAIMVNVGDLAVMLFASVVALKKCVARFHSS